MKKFSKVFAGVIAFALISILGALFAAYSIKIFFGLAVEGRYLFLACIYLISIVLNILVTNNFVAEAKNITVFGSLIIVGFIAFLELTLFSKSASVYQLYYSIGLIPLMTVLTNFRLNKRKQVAV